MFYSKKLGLNKLLEKFNFYENESKFSFRCGREDPIKRLKLLKNYKNNLTSFLGRM